MAIYRRMFVVTDVAQVHRAFLETLAACQETDLLRRRLGFPPANERVIADIKRAQSEFSDGLDAIAKSSASAANNAIRDRIAVTQKRTDSGLGRHMRDRIVSRPIGQIEGFSTGAVGVADETVLDRQGGWYWRVQEFGSGTSEAGSITTAATGRQLRGYFYDAGFANPTTIGAASRQPLFAVSGRLPGVPYAIGQVRNEIKGRHFVRDGADIAQARWTAAMRNLQTDVSGLLTSALASARSAAAP